MDCSGIMRASERFLRVSILVATALVFSALLPTTTHAEVVNAVWNAATDIPVTASGYTASGNTISFALNFGPAVGSELMIINNTGLPFINGAFGNLTNGQPVKLTYGGLTYSFVANYYGGNGK